MGTRCRGLFAGEEGGRPVNRTTTDPSPNHANKTRAPLGLLLCFIELYKVTKHEERPAGVAAWEEEEQELEGVPLSVPRQHSIFRTPSSCE